MTPILVRFMLDRVSLTPPPEDRNVHIRFLRAWQSCGILLDINVKDGSSRINDTLDTLPVRFRKIWKKALEKHLRDFIPPSLPELESIEKVEDIRKFSGKTHLLCLEDTRADLMAIEAGLKEYDGFFQPLNLNIEISRFKDTDNCTAFERARCRTQQIIPKGVSVNDVWRNNFLPLVDMHKHIFVLDRYAMEEDWSAKWNELPSRSGLQKMLREIGSHRRGHFLTLFTNSNSEMKHQDIANMLIDMLKRLNKGGIKTLILGSIAKGSFSKILHDRYVMFDSKRVCSLGPGLKILSGDKLKEPYYFSCSDEPKNVNTLKSVKENFEDAFESKSETGAIMTTVLDY